MVLNKKAISPVVATALLLVVAVVAVVGFQSWFTTYQSGINTKVEQQSNAGSVLTIERLESSANGTLYLKNAGTENVTVSSFKVLKDGATQCDDSGLTTVVAGNSVEELSGSGACDVALVSGLAYDVVVVTNVGVFQATKIAR